MLVERVLNIFFRLRMFTVTFNGHTACIVYSSNQLIALKLAYLVTQSPEYQVTGSPSRLTEKLTEDTEEEQSKKGRELGWDKRGL